MSENPFENLILQFEHMESKGEIDPSIINDLNDAIQNCIELEKYWSSRFDDIDSSFTVYHAVRNTKIITDKIINRVLISKEKSDNPKVAFDTLQILPIMSDIFNMSVKLKGEMLQNNIINYLYKLTRTLRGKSSELSLLPAFEDEMKDVDVDEIRSRLIQLSEKILEENLDEM